jgi:sporulation protein YqfC
MKSREKLGAKIRRALEIDEILGENDTLEMRGTRELTIRECRHIIHYDDEEIRLSLKEYILTIKGDGLYFTSYAGGTVCVDGRILELKFDMR